MRNLLIKLLSGGVILSIASAVYGVTIVPTWDSSIITNASAAAITNGIMAAIQAEEANLTDNSTVKILFITSTSVGLGENSTWYSTASYSSYLAALRASATSVNDSNALSKIPNSSTDPLTGNSQIELQLPLGRLLGLFSGYGNDGYDGTIYLNISLMNLTRPPLDPSKYDLISVAEHEMDEVLGFVSTLNQNYPNGPIGPMDLFRYTTNLVRTWTTSGDNAYFSVDGTNLLARFNQNSGADYHDWWSASSLWAPPGVTPYPQVQDAYAYPDTAPNIGSNELAALDVIGYTIAVPPPILKIVRSGTNRFMLSWSASYSGYTLQENTNLQANTWVASVTGSTNPAIIVSTPARKYYRLYKASVPGPLTAQTVTLQVSTNTVLQRVTHVYRPIGY